MTRTGRSLFSFLSGILLSVLTVAGSLVATPFLLGCLGEERFGAWRATSDWIGYLGLLELGLGGALLPLLSRALSRRDPVVLRDALAVGIRAYVKVSVAMAVGAAGLAFVVPWLVPVQPDLVGDLRLGCWLGALGFLIMPLAPFRALAEADQRGYVVNLLLGLQSWLILGLAVAFAWTSWGISGQCLAAFAGSIPFFVFLTMRAARRHPGLLRGLVWAPGDAQARRQLWSLNWPTLALTLCGRVSFLTDNIIIVCLLGAPAVVPFYLTQRLGIMAQIHLNGVGNSCWAPLAELHHTGKHQLFNTRLVQLSRLVAILAMAGLLPIIAYNQCFVTLWLGPQQYGGDLLTLLSAAAVFLVPILSLWGWAFMGTGQVTALVPVWVVSAVVNLIVSVAGTLLLGPLGPPLGSLVAFTVVNLCWTPLLLRSAFGIPVGELLKAVLLPVALGIPCGAAFWCFARGYPPTGWCGLALAMAGAGVAYLALYCLTILPRAERLYLGQRGQQALRAALRLRIALRPSTSREINPSQEAVTP